MKAIWLVTKSYIEDASSRNNVQPVMVAHHGTLGRIEFPPDCDPAVDVDVYGPSDASPPAASSLTLEFALVDGDMNVYYTGLCSPDAEWDPLDMYGKPNAGCSFLFVKRGGYWEMLR